MKRVSFWASCLLISAMSGNALALSQEQMQAVEKTLEQDGPQKAMLGLKRVLKATPKDKEARFLLAKTYYANKDIESATKELQRAKKLGVDASFWMPLQAKIYLQTQQFEKLLTEFADKRVPSKDISALWLSELNLAKAEALLATKKPLQAKTQLESILTLHPNHLEALLGLTELHLQSKEVSKAEQYLKKAARAKKNQLSLKEDAKIQVVQAAVYRAKNDLDSARIAYQDALNLDAQNLHARLGLVEINLLLKNKDAFIEHSTKLFEEAPKNSLALYYKALAQFAKKEVDPSIENLEMLIAMKPQHAPGHLLLGYAYYQKKRYEMSAKTLEKYLQFSPEHAGAKALLASVMLHLNEPNKTIELLKPLVEKNSHYEWLALLGHAYVIQGQLDKGIETLEKASAMMPKDPAIKVELAASLIANNQTQEATELLDELVEKDDYVQADLLRLFVALRNQENQVALKLAKQLVSQDAKNPVLQNALGLAYRADGNAKQAEQAFKQSLKLAPKFLSAMHNLAQVYIQQAEYEKAHDILDKSLKIMPSSMTSLSLKSHLALLEKEPGVAQKWLKTAQFRNPESFEPIAMLVSFYLSQNQLNEAYEQAQEGLVHFPKNPRAKHLVGQLALHKKDFDQAHSIYEDLSEHYPDNVPLLQGLARSQMGLNQVSLARESLAKILKKQNHDFAALLMSADIALSQRQYDEVQSIAQKVVQHFPKNPIGYKLLGDAALGTGKTGDAVNYYESAYDISNIKYYARSVYRALKFDKKPKQAFDFLENHLAKQDDAELRQYLATEYLMNKSLTKAQTHYKKVLEQQPNDTVSLNNLAHIYLQEGKADKALGFAKKAYDQAMHIPQVADTYAWVLIQLDRPQQAVPILTEAVSLQPDSMQLRYHRAVGLYALGDSKQAQVELEKVLNFGENFPEKSAAKALLEKIKQQG